MHYNDVGSRLFRDGRDIFLHRSENTGGVFVCLWKVVNRCLLCVLRIVAKHAATPTDDAVAKCQDFNRGIY